MKLASFLLCVLLSMLVVLSGGRAEEVSVVVAGADAEAVEDVAAVEDVVAEEDEAEAEDEEEADEESEDESEAEAEADEEADAEAEDEVFLASSEAVAAGVAAASAGAAAAKKHEAVAEDTISADIESLIKQEMDATNAKELAEQESETELHNSAEATLAATLAAAHIPMPAAAIMVEADAEAAAEVTLDLASDLGSELEAVAGDEAQLDAWLDAELPGDDKEDPLLKDAPALPRNIIEIVPPKKAEKRIAAAKKHHKKHGKHAGKRHGKHHGKHGKHGKHAGAVRANFVDPAVVKKWKNIKDTTKAYLKALRHKIKSKYGKDQAAIGAAGVSVLKDVYTTCKRFGKNKFLCAILRDLYKNEFLHADIFARPVGRKFIRRHMKKIIKFTHHHLKHPDEFTGKYLNEKYLKDPYTVCSKRMGREIRKFLRALRYSVAVVHPDLTHELVSDFNTVFATVKDRCRKLKKHVGFAPAHKLCSTLTSVLNDKFATKDVFLHRPTRAKFVRRVKKQVKRAQRAERKAKGLEGEPSCRPDRSDLPVAPKKNEDAAIAKLERSLAKAERVQKHREHRIARHNAKLKAQRAARRAARSASSTSSTSSSSSSTSDGTINIVNSRVNAAVAKDRFEITIRLNLDYSTVASNAADLDNFNRAFVTDAANALGVDKSRITITAIQTGSGSDAGTTTVKFAILPTSSQPVTSIPTDSASVDALASKFATQTQNTGSSLYSSAIFSKIVSGSTVAVTKQATTQKSGAVETSAASSVIIAAVTLAAYVAGRF